MKKFVFLVIIATAFLKDVQSYPVESAASIPVPIKVEADPIVPAKSETENVAPTKSEDDTLESAKTENEPVVPIKSDIEPVAPAKSETEPAAPTKSETEPVAPTKSEAEPVAPTKSEVEPVAPTKSEAEPVAPTKSEAEPVAPTKSEEESVEPAKSEAEPVVPDAKPVAPTKSETDPVSPAKLQVGPVDPAKTGAVENAQEKAAVDVQVAPGFTFTVPDIPKSFENSNYGSSVFGHIWSNRLFQFHKAGGILRDSAERSAPSTILVALDSLMINLVPQDAPHPLYSEGYTTLTDTFLSDFMSSEAINPDDDKLSRAEGVTIKTKTGKDLVFKKDTKTNVVTVNGIVVTKFTKLPGEPQLTVVDIDGIPFDYRNIIDSAFKELSKTRGSLSVEVPPPVVSAVESSAVNEAPKEVVGVESSPSEPLLTAEVKPKEETPIKA